MTIRYRLATAADAATLHRLLQALADHDDAGPIGPVESLLTHGFGPRPLFQAVLAEREAEVLGLVLYYPDYSTHRGQPGLYVQDFYVLHQARGLGIGKALLAQAMRLQDWGARYMTLGVDPGNAGARQFYDRLGFRPRGYEFLILDGEGLAALTER